MKPETIVNRKQWSGTKCTICNFAGTENDRVLKMSVPNYGFVWMHIFCVRDLIGPDDHEIEREMEEIRNQLKENRGIRFEG